MEQDGLSARSEKSVIVRYFPRPEKYWEGEQFPMIKLKLLRDMIEKKSSSLELNVEFKEPDNATSFLNVTKCNEVHSSDFHSKTVCCVTNDLTTLCESDAVSLLLKSAHTHSFISRLEKYANGFLPSEMARAEFEANFDKSVFEHEVRDVLGTVSACFDALSSSNCKFGFSIGGGNHHAFPDYGHGYCVLNDVSIAIQTVLRLRKNLNCDKNHNQGCVGLKILVIDLDVHQGDGVAALFGPQNVKKDVNFYPWGRSDDDLDRVKPWWLEKREKNDPPPLHP